MNALLQSGQNVFGDVAADINTVCLFIGTLFLQREQKGTLLGTKKCMLRFAPVILAYVRSSLFLDMYISLIKYEFAGYMLFWEQTCTIFIL